MGIKSETKSTILSQCGLPKRKRKEKEEKYISRPKKCIFLILTLRFNEDCGFSCCNYREHQTHFHCMRKDCNYRFCDKTRFVQHTARHERLDTLCGEEFEGFRGVPCGRPNCELNALHARSKQP